MSFLSTARAHVDSAKEIAKLLGEKFDLLQPNSPALASNASSEGGPSQATIKCLEELKDIIGNHLKVSTDEPGKSLLVLCIAGLFCWQELQHAYAAQGFCNYSLPIASMTAVMQ